MIVTITIVVKNQNEFKKDKSTRVKVKLFIEFFWLSWKSGITKCEI